MHFFHAADIHLGAEPDREYPWGEARKKEVWDSFGELIAEANKRQVDLLLIAGDLFHRQPLYRELKEVNYLFSTLTHTKVVLIAGNHDCLRRDSYYRRFPWNNNVSFIQSPSGERVVFPELHTAVYGMSYEEREIREGIYDRWKPKADGLYSILLGHGGDEKHIPIDQRRLSRAGFDYIALGHIHKPQILEENRMAYAGALEPLDRTELGAHGYIYGVEEQGKTTLRFIPWAAREYRMLEIKVGQEDTRLSLTEQIRSQISAMGSHHIYRIRLIGERAVDLELPIEEWKTLGNIIEIVDNSHLSLDYEKLYQDHKEDVLGHFIEALYGEQRSEVEKKALAYGVQVLMEVEDSWKY